MSSWCTCTPSSYACCYWTSTTWVPFVVETPKWAIPNYIDSIPFWIWIVVACGALLVLLIVIFMCVLCCCKNRMCFWCCCEGFDSESQAAIVEKDTADDHHRDRLCGRTGPQIMYRYPDDDASDYGYACSRIAANDSYVPRAQRLTSGRQQIVRVEDIDEMPLDEGRRSILGSTLTSSRLAKPPGLALVTIGGSASVTAPSAVRTTNAVGYHSAAIQVASGGGGVHRGQLGTTLSVPSTSIYPAL